VVTQRISNQLLHKLLRDSAGVKEEESGEEWWTGHGRSREQATSKPGKEHGLTTPRSEHDLPSRCNAYIDARGGGVFNIGRGGEEQEEEKEEEEEERRRRRRRRRILWRRVHSNAH
jgi:hypothetical protein